MLGDAGPAIVIESNVGTTTVSMGEDFGAIAAAGDGDTGRSVVIEGQLPDATPGNGRFGGSRVENRTVTEGPPDETPGQGPPSTVPLDRGLGATLTGDIRTVIHLRMNRPE